MKNKKKKYIKEYNMESEYIGEREVNLCDVSFFGKHIENFGDLKRFINENPYEFSDDTPLFYKKGHNTIEPLLLELYEGAEESYLAFENGNSNKF